MEDELECCTMGTSTSTLKPRLSIVNLHGTLCFAVPTMRIWPILQPKERKTQDAHREQIIPSPNSKTFVNKSW